ncbi:MAG: response regulator [Candidatus Binatia bacterium]
MKPRILLAEDNKDAAEIITFVLQFLGYEIVVARDGVEAVESAMSLRPDLIIMDMMMPRMDGFEAVSELRRHPETKTIPILAATAMAGSEDRKKCLAVGCDEHLPKPLSPKTLGPVIQRLLRVPANNELTRES